MTREPQVGVESWLVRGVANSLFFNKLDYTSNMIANAKVARPRAFARSYCYPQSKHHVASAEHRPASRPGAD